MKNKLNNISKKKWDDIESPPLSNEMLSRMRPVSETHPEIPRRVRGAQKSPTKISTSIRLSPQVVEHFKALGKGWQARVDKILCQYVESHKYRGRG